MKKDDEVPNAPARGNDYRSARIGAGMALTVTLMVLLIYDAANPVYEMQPFVLITMVTTILTLFGLEVADQIRKG